MNVEPVIISKIIQDGDPALQYFIREGIKGEYFGDERTGSVYDWIVGQWQEHGAVPTAGQFGRQFPTFELFDVEDKLSALVEELRALHARNVATQLMPGITKELTKKVNEIDLERVMAGIAELQQQVNVITASTDVVIGSEFADTYLTELFNMDPDAMPGITTGFKILDGLSGGWQPEQFVVWGAAPKRFKTTLMLWSAMCAREVGKIAMVVSFEMSNRELVEREYCFGAQVPLDHIQRRMFNERDRDRLEMYTRKLKKGEGEIVYVHDINAATTLSGLMAQAKSLPQRPDIIFIDGMYQMTDDTKRHDNETAALTAVSRGLKRFAAKLEIPIVGTTQMLLSRISKTQGSHMDSFGYTRAFAQDANVLVGLDRNDMTTNDVIYKVIAARSMVGTNFGISLDFERGIIQETGEVDLSGDAGDGYEHD